MSKCCLYRKESGKRWTLCTEDEKCPDITGDELVGEWSVADCDDCLAVGDEVPPAEVPPVEKPPVEKPPDTRPISWPGDPYSVGAFLLVGPISEQYRVPIQDWLKEQAKWEMVIAKLREEGLLKDPLGPLKR